ncbi:hypothetical protein [Crateriforma spongiae]|uniref:hypothetical protein n=1 Tax=Crateriforma spongiae TaxID=2724528 RepID=UPI0039AF684A
MNVIQLFSVCAFMMPIGAPNNANLQRDERPIAVPLGENAVPVAQSEPEVRISIGIDPLDWIKTNRY